MIDTTTVIAWSFLNKALNMSDIFPGFSSQAGCGVLQLQLGAHRAAACFLCRGNALPTGLFGGTHERFVIFEEKFAAKAEAKKG